MLLETHSGIFFALLVLIAMGLIVSFILARKLAFKHIPVAIILACSTIFWFISSLGPRIIVDRYISIYNVDLIPFSTVFKTINDFQGFQSNDDFFEYYLLPHLWILGITFIFGIIWGITTTILIKNKSIKKLILISCCTILPLELLINLLHIFQISYERYYDTSRYFLLLLGAVIGYLIFNMFCKISKEKK